MAKELRKAKVVTLSISGKGNKIFRSKEVISEDQVSNFDELLKGKHIEEVKDTKK